MITVRPVENDADIDTFVEIRRRVQSESPLPREVVVEDEQKPDHLGLIAELDGEPVGAASAGKVGGAPDGEFAAVTIRVVEEARRRGVGTALDLRCSQDARELGKTRLFVFARYDDEDSLGYFDSRGFEEIGRMQDVRLDLSTAVVERSAPAESRSSSSVPSTSAGRTRLRSKPMRTFRPPRPFAPARSSSGVSVI